MNLVALYSAEGPVVAVPVTVAVSVQLAALVASSYWCLPTAFLSKPVSPALFILRANLIGFLYISLLLKLTSVSFCCLQSRK